MPLFKHGDEEQGSTSHVAPVYPSGQIQMYPSNVCGVSRQDPPFVQGDESHGEIWHCVPVKGNTH